VTKQLENWAGAFGEEYIRRNPNTIEDYERLYLETIGLTRTELNQEFLGSLPRTARILEVGTNVGMQLALLDRAGFSNLYGVEIQWKAIDVLRTRVPRANVVHASAFEIPFRDGFFDLVFTSGVLIHIDPFSRTAGAESDLQRALREIERCSRRYILGDEYFAEQLQEIPYRGHEQMLWKGDYAAEYRRLFPGLRLLRERKLPHQGSSNVDMMFLLEKGAASA
jgi:pseudaminic acid biosynthesis-associated methylase